MKKEQADNHNNRYWWAAAFVIVFAVSLLYAARADIYEYYYDSGSYWNLSGVISENGLSPINILKFPRSIRGYFFPVLAGYFRLIFRGVWGWRILASLSMAFFFSLSLPLAFRGRKIGSPRELMLTLLTYAVYMWVWGDLMQYPLSDFISCFLTVSAIACLRSVRPDGKVITKLIRGAAAGMLLYAAYNTRTTFLYGGILILLAFILINRRDPGTLLTVSAAAVIGAGILSLPQCYINMRHEGAFSPKVFYDLADTEVYRGLYTARYETYAGDPDGYPRPNAVFDDVTGWEIVKRENLSPETFKIKDIFGLIRKYPADMLGIYFRHFVNLLTPLYRQIYLKDVTAADPLCSIISILIWLAAGFGLLTQIREKGITLNALWAVALCLPGMLQIIDEPELRFFLPVFLLGYYYLFVMTDHKQYLRALKANRLQVLLISLAVFGLWLSLIGNTAATLRSKTLLLSENTVYVPDPDR